MNALSGKKTYLVAALAGIAMALRVAGVIDDEMLRWALGLLGVGGVVTMRAAVAKAERANGGK
jgi:hypothetical protein